MPSPGRAPARSVSSSSISSSNPVLSSTAVSTRRPASVYDRNVQRRRGDVSLSSFAYIFSEIIQYCHKQAKDIADLERRLNRLGYHVGLRTLELVALREGKLARRETKVLGILQFINTSLWRALFGRQADSMQISTDDPTQYMIIDHDPLVTEYISVPKDMPSLNCAAFVAGVIEAALDASLFDAQVTAHTMETDEYPWRTVYLVRFKPEVIEHDKHV